MTNHLSAKGAEAFLSGALDWVGDNWIVAAVKTTYAYSAAHDFQDDITSQAFPTTVALTGRTAVAGVAHAANVTVPSAAGLTLGGIWIIHDTGSTATSELVHWIDHTSTGGSIVGVVTTASGLVLQWPATGIFRLT